MPNPAPQPEPSLQIAKVEIDRELCIGAATCISLAPEYFELDPENKAVAKPGAKATDEVLLNAAKSCPVFAIYLYGQDGRKIYPE